MDIVVTISGIVGVIYLILMGLLWYSVKYSSNSKCTQDCDQGRNCTCGKKDNADGIS